MIQPPKIEWVIACQKVNMAIIVYGVQVPHHKRRSFTPIALSQISPGRLSKINKSKSQKKKKEKEHISTASEFLKKTHKPLLSQNPKHPPILHLRLRYMVPIHTPRTGRERPRTTPLLQICQRLVRAFRLNHDGSIPPRINK
jgi:hypothetical protein